MTRNTHVLKSLADDAFAISLRKRKKTARAEVLRARGLKAVAPRTSGHTISSFSPHAAHANTRSPLVLLHPFASCARVWNPIRTTLEASHEVFALAIPGHFEADPAPDGFRHTVEEAVGLVEAKLDALGIKQAHLVGNSLGGWIAIELARRGRASSVVALAPGGGWELGSRQHRRLMQKFRVMGALLSLGGPLAFRLTHLNAVRALMLRDAVAHPHRVKSEEAKLLIEAAFRCEIYKNAVKAMATQALPAPFSQLPCRVRFVWGSRDRILPMPDYSMRWQRVLPGAEWLVLDGAGHMPMFDAPDEVARAILDVTTAVTQRQAA